MDSLTDMNEETAAPMGPGEVDQLSLEPASSKPRKVDWPVASFIVAIHLAAVAGFFCFSWSALLVGVVLYFATACLGITLGYHRLLTHRSFKTPKPLEYFFTLMACLACQSGPLTWVAGHRLHHLKSDQEGDPHSPLKSFFWGHMGWIFFHNERINTPEGLARFAPDLAADKGHVFLEKTHIWWTLFLSIALYLWGGWPFVVWGVFVRTVLAYHATWFVNSAAHVWGYRSHPTKDNSRNLWWVAAMTYGEGWHNNHHAFQYSARHGLKWWEIDITYGVIKFLSWFGLAKSIKLPSNLKNKA